MSQVWKLSFFYYQLVLNVVVCNQFKPSHAHIHSRTMTIADQAWREHSNTQPLIYAAIMLSKLYTSWYFMKIILSSNGQFVWNEHFMRLKWLGFYYTFSFHLARIHFPIYMVSIVTFFTICVAHSSIVIITLSIFLNKFFRSVRLSFSPFYSERLKFDIGLVCLEIFQYIYLLYKTFQEFLPCTRTKGKHHKQ